MGSFVVLRMRKLPTLPQMSIDSVGVLVRWGSMIDPIVPRTRSVPPATGLLGSGVAETGVSCEP